MEKMRAYDVMKMELFGTKLETSGFAEFKYMIPKEALTLATDEAIERGLLTKI